MATIEDIQNVFNVGDQVETGGGNTYFEVVGFTDNSVRIRPINAQNERTLHYDKLLCVIHDFGGVNPDQIEVTVRQVLGRCGLTENVTEVYLYGMAREFISRNVISMERIEQEIYEQVAGLNEEEVVGYTGNHGEAPRSRAVVTVFRRDSRVIKAVLVRANGKCEECGNEAPFVRPDGSPYLEVHRGCSKLCVR